MKAVLMIIAAVGAGALGYRYWERNAGKLPALEALGDPGQKLSDRSRQLHDAIGQTAAATS